MEEIFAYLKDVLGVRYLPVEVAPHKLVFMVESPVMENSPESQLLSRMISAMGLGPDQFCITNVIEGDPKVIVMLGAVRAPIKQVDGRKVISTFSPSYLLKNPSEKKNVWEDLKLAMSELGLSVQSPGTKK